MTAMRLGVELEGDELSAAMGVLHTNGQLFSLGYAAIAQDSISESFFWLAAYSGTILKAIEGLWSFRTEGSGAQKLYGKVLRLHSSRVN